MLAVPADSLNRGATPPNPTHLIFPITVSGLIAAGPKSFLNVILKK
jgi:hypothetical protein